MTRPGADRAGSSSCSGTGELIYEVTLSHGDRRIPTAGHTYLHVTTRSATNAHDDQHRTDSVRALAWLGLFTLMSLMAPDTSELSRRDLFWRNALAYVDQRADRCRRWATATWVIDGVSSAARFARFAGAWTGFVSLADGIGLVVVGYRISPHGLGITRVTSGEPYGFDLAAPIRRDFPKFAPEVRHLHKNLARYWVVAKRRHHNEIVQTVIRTSARATRLCR